MSTNAFGGKQSRDVKISDDVKMNMDSLNCLLPMGITSENVASKI